MDLSEPWRLKRWRAPVIPPTLPSLTRPPETHGNLEPRDCEASGIRDPETVRRPASGTQRL
jgi:hypothetical protein